MHLISSVVALGLLSLGNTASTVTVFINTGVCPATYSTSLASGYSSSSKSSSISVSVSSASSNSIFSGTSTSATSSPTSFTRTPCPAQFGTPYMGEDGSVFQLFCNSAIVGSDLPAVNAASLDDCLEQCDSYIPPNPDTQYNGSYCVAVTYTAAAVAAGNCQLKYNITYVQVLTSQADSAKLARFAVSPSVSSSIGSVIAGYTAAPPSQTMPPQSGSMAALSSHGSMSSGIASTSLSSAVVSSMSFSGATSAGSASITASSTPSTSTAISTSIVPYSSTVSNSSPSGTASTIMYSSVAPTNSPPGAASTSPASSAAPSSVPSSMPTVSSASPSTASGSPTPCPCPADNNQTVYDTLGYDFQVYCDESFQLLQGPGSVYAASLNDCMLACDAYVDNSTYAACSGAAYVPYDPENGLNCFLTTDANPYTTGELGACIALVPAGG